MSSRLIDDCPEAVAAIRGMQETYGRPLPSIGQWVTGSCYGKSFSGSVSEIQAGFVIVEVDGAWVAVRPSDIDADDGIPSDVLVVDPTEL